MSKIQVPALLLKTAAPPEERRANDEAASVMPKGRIVHIGDSGHNFHDELDRTVEALHATASACGRHLPRGHWAECLHEWIGSRGLLQPVSTSSLQRGAGETAAR